MPRSVIQWIGKTDDTPPPPRVRVRIFEKYDGRCHKCTRKIMPGGAWQADHVLALVNGGINSEQNLAPICESCHLDKTRSDVQIKSKSYRRRAKHIGVKLKRRKSQWSCGRDSAWKKKLSGEVVRR